MAPTASATTPAALSAPRRLISVATSPKYGLSLVLGTGAAHWSPHLYTQVRCWRLEIPGVAIGSRLRTDNGSP